jgi:hypothetical protein
MGGCLYESLTSVGGKGQHAEEDSDTAGVTKHALPKSGNTEHRMANRPQYTGAPFQNRNDMLLAPPPSPVLGLFLHTFCLCLPVPVPMPMLGA